MSKKNYKKEVEKAILDAMAEGNEAAAKAATEKIARLMRECACEFITHEEDQHFVSRARGKNLYFDKTREDVFDDFLLRIF